MRGFGVHSRYGLHTRAVTICDALSEDFSYFVTSIAAPVASGWSVAGWDLHPLEKRRLITAHTRSGHLGRVEGFGGASHHATGSKDVHRDF